MRRTRSIPGMSQQQQISGALDNKQKNVVEDRHGLASTVVAAQLPINHWHDNIRDPTIADAVLDRLVHNAYKIHLKGESLRESRSSLTKQKDSEK